MVSRSFNRECDIADSVDLMNNVGVTLAEEGHHAESKKMLRETLEIRRRVLGPEHPKTAETLDLGPTYLTSINFSTTLSSFARRFRSHR
jgi:hypothetical protein